jgi:hypothetical protein
MVFKNTLLIFCLLFTVTSWAQSPPLPDKEQIQKAVSQLLPSRNHTVAVMDGVTMNPRLQVLLLKFQQGIQKNPEVAQAMQKAVAAKQFPMPYDRRLGLTKAEYEEMQVLIDKREIKSVSTGTQQVTVTNQAGIIRFAAQDKIAMLNDFWLDTNRNEAHVGNHTLTFDQVLDITSSNNAYGSAWTGYRWEFMTPKDLDLTNYDMRNLSNLNATMYRITVGKIAKTGQTLVQIKGMEIEGGVRTVSFETPLFFE